MANKVGELAKCRSKRSDEIYACVPLRVRNRMPYLDVFYHKLEYLPLSLSLSLVVRRDFLSPSVERNESFVEIEKNNFHVAKPMDNKADRRAGAREILIEMSYKRNGTDLLLFEGQRWLYFTC